MKNIVRKLFIVVVCLAMCLSVSLSSFAVEKNIIDNGLVEEVGQLFVDSQTEEIPDSEHFSKGAKIVLNEVFYDLQGNPSAYNYSVVSTENFYEGYVVVGAQKNYSPVIEYGFCNKKYSVSESISNLKSDFKVNKIYYLGGIDYIIEASNTKGEYIFFDTSNRNQIASMQKKELKKFLMKNKKALNSRQVQLSFENEWDNIESASKNRTIEILNRNEYTIGHNDTVRYAMVYSDLVSYIY